MPFGTKESTEISRDRRWLLLGALGLLFVGCDALADPLASQSADSPGGTFAPGPSDIVARFFHRASMLPDGRVMVTGGLVARLVPPQLFPADTISFFDPAANRFSRRFKVASYRDRHKGSSGNAARDSNYVTPLLAIARSSHTQTTLIDGRVLLTGGNTRADHNKPGAPTASVEIFNSRTGAMSAGPMMSEPRAYHSATLLPDGRVVVAGGGSWQIFDPVTNLWSSPVPLARRRERHAAVLMTVGTGTAFNRVLLIGGAASGATLETLDPEILTSELLPVHLTTGVFDSAAVRLPDGRVLIAGGQKEGSGETLSDTVVWDPVKVTLTKLTPPSGVEHGWGDHEMLVIGDYVVAFGGEQQIGKDDIELRRALVLSVKSLSWVNTLQMRHPHDDFAAVRLQDGRVMLIGGGRGVLGLEAPAAHVEFFLPDSHISP